MQNSNTQRVLEAFDEAASGVLESLSEAGIEVFPQSSMIVKRPQDGAATESETEKKKSDF